MCHRQCCSSKCWLRWWEWQLQLTLGRFPTTVMHLSLSLPSVSLSHVSSSVSLFKSPVPLEETRPTVFKYVVKQHVHVPWEMDTKTDIWLRSPMRKKPLESNINKNNVNAEALEMWSADSAPPCLITVHLGQRPNGRLGCGPRQTTFHLASTTRKSWVWLIWACWCHQSTNCRDKLQT